MKRILLYAICLSGALSASLGLHAQNDITSYRDFDYVRDINPWLSSVNGASLTTFASANLSRADIHWQYAKGGLVDYYQSPSASKTGGSVESYYRLSKRVVTYGKISYDHFYGHRMAGSAFIDPSRKPFDLTEDSITNVGNKERDTYNLIGSIGVDVYHGFSLGAKVDYTSANSAKYKDLREKNSYMDLNLTVGFYFPVGKAFSFGGDYFYRRNTESLRFSTYGKNDKTYKTLINYGGFIGEVEQFGGDGFTDKQNELPLFDEYGGGSLQAELRFGDFSLFNSFLMANRHGYYGKQSAYSIVYTHHHSDVYAYNGCLSLRSKNNFHQLLWNLDIENLKNDRSTYRLLQNESGSNYYQYYDAVKTGNKVWVNGTVAYRGYLGVKNEEPTWIIYTGMNIMHRKITAYYYPYYRRQSIGNAEGFVELSRNWHIFKGLFTTTVGGSYLNGHGDVCTDGTFMEPSDKQSFPDQMVTYLHREYEYLTSSQYSIEGSAKYAFTVPKTNLQSYVKAEIHHHKANETDAYMEGKDNNSITLSIGCTF
ncbi:MAG: hypothetical protein LKG25_05280 [Prevotella sp.]|nr:hypothetical protein [Prevotella sp.]MCI1281988.1 hypothetical protein [Prevotella sp.]